MAPTRLIQSLSQVLVVDDHSLFRQGVRRLIEETGEFHVVAEASTGHEAIRLVEACKPDIALIDIQLPGVTGLRIARILKKKHPSLKIVIISMHLDDERLFTALRAGVSAFLTKDISSDELLSALRRVAVGEQVIDDVVMSRPQVAQQVLMNVRKKPNDRTSDDDLILDSLRAPLSIREIEILDCMAQGLTNRAIGDKLFISEQTVKNHISSMLRKLSVEHRLQAVLHGIRSGWIDLGSTSDELVVD